MLISIAFPPTLPPSSVESGYSLSSHLLSDLNLRTKVYVYVLVGRQKLICNTSLEMSPKCVWEGGAFLFKKYIILLIL